MNIKANTLIKEIKIEKTVIRDGQFFNIVKVKYKFLNMVLTKIFAIICGIFRIKIKIIDGDL